MKYNDFASNHQYSEEFVINAQVIASIKNQEDNPKFYHLFTKTNSSGLSPAAVKFKHQNPPTSNSYCSPDVKCELHAVDHPGKLLTRWLREFSTELNKMKDMEYNWDGFESDPPNLLAIRTASEVLYSLHDVQLRPTSINPSAEEGVAISFFNKGKYAIIECYNDGDIIMACSDSQNRRKVWEFNGQQDEINDHLVLLGGFLNAL